MRMKSRMTFAGALAAILITLITMRQYGPTVAHGMASSQLRPGYFGVGGFPSPPSLGCHVFNICPKQDHEALRPTTTQFPSPISRNAASRPHVPKPPSCHTIHPSNHPAIQLSLYNHVRRAPACDIGSLFNMWNTHERQALFSTMQNSIPKKETSNHNDPWPGIIDF